MKRVSRLTTPNALLSLCFLAGVVIVSIVACEENPVGRKCFIGGSSLANQTIVSSPALECQSRTCLHLDQNAYDLCTASCESDSDCDPVPESPCKGGFSCQVVSDVGPFCCKKMCVCSDYLQLPDGGLPPRASCDPSNASNECCNLAGRRDNRSLYPACAK